MHKLRMMGIGVTLVLSGAVLSFGAAGESQRIDAENGGARWTQETERLMDESRKIGDMTGNRVRNHQEERLGSVNDLVIKLPSGEIEYAVISSGGVFGVGGTNRLVPYEMLSMSGDEGEFRLDVDEEMWDELPEFDKEEMDELESEGFRDQLKESLGFDDDSEDRSRERGERPSRDGDRDEDRYENAETDRGEQRSRERGERDERSAIGMNGASHYLVSDVLGYDVVDTEDESVGRVSDFLIGEDDKKISHVLLSIGGFLRIGDEKFAVSPEELNFDKEEGKVRLPVGREAFSDERTEDHDNWFENIFN